MMNTRRLSPALYGLAVAGFLLPWVNITCGGQQVARFTGMEFVTGTTIDSHDFITGEPIREHLDSQPWAVVAIVLIATGLAAGLISGAVRTVATVGGVLGGLAVVALLQLKSVIDGLLLKETDGAVVAHWSSGFWGLMLLLLLTVGWNAWSLWRRAHWGGRVPRSDGASSRPAGVGGILGVRASELSTTPRPMGHSLSVGDSSDATDKAGPLPDATNAAPLSDPKCQHLSL